MVETPNHMVLLIAINDQKDQFAGHTSIASRKRADRSWGSLWQVKAVVFW